MLSVNFKQSGLVIAAAAAAGYATKYAVEKGCEKLWSSGLLSKLPAGIVPTKTMETITNILPKLAGGAVAAYISKNTLKTLFSFIRENFSFKQVQGIAHRVSPYVFTKTNAAVVGALGVTTLVIFARAIISLRNTLGDAIGKAFDIR